MTEQGKQEILDYLQTIRPEQPFTMEQLMRAVGQNNGNPWTMFELEYIEEIAQELLQGGLIKDTGNTTKVYTK